MDHEVARGGLNFRRLAAVAILLATILVSGACTAELGSGAGASGSARDSIRTAFPSATLDQSAATAANPSAGDETKASPAAPPQLTAEPTATALPKATAAPRSTARPKATPKPKATPVDPYADAKAAGATAVCADGTWSYSAHRSGTCSKHGGVHWWTGNLGPAGPGAH
jgi:hypothetical protein